MGWSLAGKRAVTQGRSQNHDTHTHSAQTHSGRSDRRTLTLEALVLLQPQDAADVLDAARGELVVVFAGSVRGLREHQVAAFAARRAQVAAVQALVVLQPRRGEVSHSVTKAQSRM